MSMQFSRRDVVRGMLGGAVGLALTPVSLANLGPPPGMIALRFNENPYGPSPGALKAAAKAAALGAYYADGMETPLLRTISARHDVGLENMVLSSGSNEALQAAFVAWGSKGRIVLPSLTYTEHVSYARRMGVEVVPVPLKDDMTIDLDGIAAAVSDDVSLVYICNPNNPTGHTLDGDALRDFCRSIGGRAVVMIDEAYNELTDRPEYTSMVDLVRDGPTRIYINGRSRSRRRKRYRHAHVLEAFRHGGDARRLRYRSARYCQNDCRACNGLAKRRRAGSGEGLLHRRRIH